MTNPWKRTNDTPPPKKKTQNKTSFTQEKEKKNRNVEHMEKNRKSTLR